VFLKQSNHGERIQEWVPTEQAVLA